jgi:hypothetical protein
MLSDISVKSLSMNGTETAKNQAWQNQAQKSRRSLLQDRQHTRFPRATLSMVRGRDVFTSLVRKALDTTPKCKGKLKARRRSLFSNK